MAHDPNPQQAAVVTHCLTQSSNLNVVARAGAGKCLGTSTPVMLCSGRIVAVEDVRPGDLLMGPDSEPRLVHSISKGFGQLYKITPIKGPEWFCNDVHMMTLTGSTHRKEEVIDVVLRDFLESRNTQRADKEWKLFRVPLSFPEREVPYDPYVVGTWLGDGSVGEPRWTLGYGKVKIKHKLEELAKKNGCGHSFFDDKRNSSWVLSYITLEERKGGGTYRTRNPFRYYVQEQLYSDGQKRIPEVYLRNSKEIRMAVLAGLLDTDGHQSSPTTFDFVTKYTELCEDMLFLCRSLGLAAYDSIKHVKLKGWEHSRPYCRISISGDFSEFAFERHTPSARKQIKNVLKTGWDAEPAGAGDFYGFTLSGDGRFLLGDFTVTHNTTTLIQVASGIPGRVYLGAFNRAIADELSSRLPQRPGLEANTLHGAGLRAWRREYRNAIVDSHKVRTIAKRTWAVDNRTAIACDMVVSMAKQGGLGLTQAYEDVDLWEGIIEHYDLEDEIPATVKRKVFLEGCVWTYEQSLAWCEGKGGAPRGVSVVDFNDMLLAPLYFHLPLPQFDWVLIDELQDTSDLRRRIATGMMRAGRFVGVGDEKQAIYGFSGATSDAMDLVKAQLNCAELPLNVTYRCPTRIVDLARTWVPDFTAHPANPEGVVRTISHKDFWLEKLDPATDVVLCRYTRPLTGIAATLRDRGLPCVVEGQSAKSLVALASKWGEVGIKGYLVMLDDWEEAECTRLAVDDNLEKAARLRDRAGTVRALARRMGSGATTRDLARAIEMMFRDDARAGVLHLCTVHRAKGREWDRVYLIGRNEYMPSIYARQEWERVQENNLQYVAITRAKRELVEVDVPGSEPGKRKEREWWELY